MKTIKEIQQQLDTSMQQLTAVCRYVPEEAADVIRNAVLTLQSASAELSGYATEAEKTESRFDFEAVELKTNRIYTRHAAQSLTDDEKYGYLMLLCNTMFGENSSATDCLAYIFGIALSIDYDGDCRTLYARSLNMSPPELDRVISPLRNIPAAAKSLIVDMIVLSERYITDKNTSRKYITQMIEMLGIDSDDADYLIAFAKVLITGSIKGFSGSGRFIDDDLVLYLKGTPKLMKQVEDSRSMMYMKIEPHTREEKYGFFGSNTHFYPYELRSISAKQKGNELVCCLTSDYQTTTIHYHMPKNSGLFELEKNIALSWVPAAGFFHSPLDIEAEAYEWYDAQPETDPHFRRMDLDQLLDIAINEAWCITEYEEMY